MQAFPGIRPKRSYKAAEKHLGTVESVGRAFEDKWNGVFKGPLAPRTIDELTDIPTWRANAQAIVDNGLPRAIEDYATNLDGYYKAEIERPLSDLAPIADTLPDDQKSQARAIVDELRRSIETSIRDRIVAMHVELAASFNWAKPASIQETFDRNELANVIKG